MAIQMFPPTYRTKQAFPLFLIQCLLCLAFFRWLPAASSSHCVLPHFSHIALSSLYKCYTSIFVGPWAQCTSLHLFRKFLIELHSGFDLIQLCVAHKLSGPHLACSLFFWLLYAQDFIGITYSLSLRQNCPFSGQHSFHCYLFILRWGRVSHYVE